MSALAAATLALGLTAVPPVPVPRPDAGAPSVTGAASETQAAPQETIQPPPRNLDEMTVFEIILQDLEQLGATEEAQGQTPASPVPEPARGADVTVSDRETRVPVPPVRPAVLPSSPARQRRAADAVCGDPRLTGTMIPQVRGKNSACGIATPVRLTAVNGIKLSTPATVRCDTARTFADWLTKSADPQARADLGAPVSSVWVMASYACRTRNHRKGARLSEHSFGRAIDVGGFVLANGRKITLSDNWNKGTPGRFLRTVWKRACGPFKTVLGPESDRFHRNHFHLDIAQRRSTFCR
ncbi:MAG: extensin family protein [Pseudomonadota bacterium]